MSYRVMHLTLTPHPAPISKTAIDYACQAALRFSAKLKVTSPRLNARVPTHFLASGMMAGLKRQFDQEAAAKSEELEAYVAKKAEAIGVDVRVTKVAEAWPWSAGDMAWRGRTSDLCVLGLPQTSDEDRFDVEDWIFGVGRPCLLYPNESQVAFGLDSVLVAWDFSKAAVRAISDALPMLKASKKVRLMTVRGEKEIRVEDIKTPIIELLAAHDVEAEFIEVELGSRSVGAAMLQQAQQVNANMIVMGAYGHSRLKEFVLGGATKEILNTTRIPLLMSH